jgi:hypothetical protein
MASLREYYETDFRNYFSTVKNCTIGFEKMPNLEFPVRLHRDLFSNSMFLSCYVEEHPETLAVIHQVIKELGLFLKWNNELQISSENKSVGDLSEAHSNTLVFTGRIYFYYESDVDLTALRELKSKLGVMGLRLIFKNMAYAKERSSMERPIAFVSHDARDKDIAKEISIGLMRSMCPVWYDEFSLKVGESLRESIEKGLKECDRCILILSKNYLNNSGWTKTEFDSIFTREIIQTKKLVLPVWCDVDREEVFQYSPSLADRFAVKWEAGEAEVIRKLTYALKGNGREN